MAWRASPRQHALADAVGRLLARRRTSDIVDAAVVLAAIEHDAEVITLNGRLFALLDAAAPTGWEVLIEPNVRLGTDRDVIPDTAILSRADMDTLINDAADVVLVAEIVSPGHAAYERLLTPRLYAQAGIRWYLRVEPTALTAHLHELRDGEYVEVAAGTTIELAEPFPARLDLPGLWR